jgi:hypothetical protein
MSPDLSSRPAECPRCGRDTRSAEAYLMAIPGEEPGMTVVEPSDGGLPDEWLSDDHTTERWVKYEPCKCVVPPEEHNYMTSDRWGREHVR